MSAPTTNRSYVKFLELTVSFFPKALFYETGGDFYIKIPSTYAWKLLYFLRNHSLSLFEQLIDLSIVDYFERKLRFEVFYNLLSLSFNRRIVVSASVEENSCLDSISSIYPSAGWYERESWDMFGVLFSNNSDLRRMLTDYGFKGHPLRKDFPLTGFIEVRYDDFSKRVLYEGVSLTQEYRIFSLDNSWSSGV